MENGRSRRAPITASIVVLLLAGCGLPADEAPTTGARATPIGPPSDVPRLPDLRIVPAELRAAALEGAGEPPLPEAFRAERSDRRPDDERFDRPGRDEGEFGARAEEVPAVDPCFAECGRDRACRMMCLDGFDRGGDGDGDCLECGRETGFLGRPELRVAAVIDGKAVVLEWTAVEGARRYQLYGLRWPQPGVDGGAAYSWETRRTRLRADLEEGHVYTFYVVAIGAGDDIRSKPSRAVTVRL